jgi:hypothetical protein
LAADTLAPDSEASEAVYEAVDSDEAFQALADEATAAGSSGFVALDLMVELGWRR